jgi:hypothetical protein
MAALIGGVLALMGGLWLFRAANYTDHAAPKAQAPAGSPETNAGPVAAKRIALEGSPIVTNAVFLAIREDLSGSVPAPLNPEAMALLHSTIQTLAGCELEKRKNPGPHASNHLRGLQRTLFARDMAYSATFAGWGDCTNGKAIFERLVGPRLENASLEDLETMRGWQ